MKRTVLILTAIATGLALGSVIATAGNPQVFSQIQGNLLAQVTNTSLPSIAPGTTGVRKELRDKRKDLNEQKRIREKKRDEVQKKIDDAQREKRRQELNEQDDQDFNSSEKANSKRFELSGGYPFRALDNEDILELSIPKPPNAKVGETVPFKVNIKLISEEPFYAQGSDETGNGILEGSLVRNSQAASDGIVVGGRANFEGGRFTPFSSDGTLTSTADFTCLEEGVTSITFEMDLQYQSLTSHVSSNPIELRFSPNETLSSQTAFVGLKSPSFKCYKEADGKIDEHIAGLIAEKDDLEAQINVLEGYLDALEKAERVLRGGNTGGTTVSTGGSKGASRGRPSSSAGLKERKEALEAELREKQGMCIQEEAIQRENEGFNEGGSDAFKAVELSGGYPFRRLDNEQIFEMRIPKPPNMKVGETVPFRVNLRLESDEPFYVQGTDETGNGILEGSLTRRSKAISDETVVGGVAVFEGGSFTPFTADGSLSSVGDFTCLEEGVTQISYSIDLQYQSLTSHVSSNPLELRFAPNETISSQTGFAGLASPEFKCYKDRSAIIKDCEDDISALIQELTEIDEEIEKAETEERAREPQTDGSVVIDLPLGEESDEEQEVMATPVPGAILKEDVSKIGSDLVNLPPLPGSTEVNSYGIAQVLGIKINCPEQVFILSEIKDKLDLYHFNAQIARSADSTGSLSAEAREKTLDRLLELRQEIEQLIEKLKTACKKPLNDPGQAVLPDPSLDFGSIDFSEGYDVRFLELYLENIKAECEEHQDALDELKKLIDDYKVAERSSGSNLRGLKDQISETMKKLQKPCPKGDLSGLDDDFEDPAVDSAERATGDDFEDPAVDTAEQGSSVMETSGLIIEGFSSEGDSDEGLILVEPIPGVGANISAVGGAYIVVNVGGFPVRVPGSNGVGIIAPIEQNDIWKESREVDQIKISAVNGNDLLLVSGLTDRIGKGVTQVKGTQEEVSLKITVSEGDSEYELTSAPVKDILMVTEGEEVEVDTSLNLFGSEDKKPAPSRAISDTIQFLEEQFQTGDENSQTSQTITFEGDDGIVAEGSTQTFVVSAPLPVDSVSEEGLLTVIAMLDEVYEESEKAENEARSEQESIAADRAAFLSDLDKQIALLSEQVDRLTKEANKGRERHILRPSGDRIEGAVSVGDSDISPLLFFTPFFTGESCSKTLHIESPSSNTFDEISPSQACYLDCMEQTASVCTACDPPPPAEGDSCIENNAENERKIRDYCQEACDHYSVIDDLESVVVIC